MTRSTHTTRAARFLEAWQRLDRIEKTRSNARREFESAARAIATRDGIDSIDGGNLGEVWLRGALSDYLPHCAPEALTDSDGKPAGPFVYLEQTTD